MKKSNGRPQAPNATTIEGADPKGAPEGRGRPSPRSRKKHSPDTCPACKDHPEKRNYCMHPWHDDTDDAIVAREIARGQA